MGWLRHGFTMVELLIAMVVLAVLAGLAAPSFNEQMARRRLEGVATDLSTDLQFARSQAVADRGVIRVVIENGGTRYRLINGTGTDVKTVNLPDGITATNGVTVVYDQLRGMSNATQIVVSNTRTAAQLRVDTAVMGRVSICTPGGGMKGYSSC
jgi:prepilin-type N-terminal cleavage/methylation domain-containing protein